MAVPALAARRPAEAHASSGGPDLARVLRSIPISRKDKALDLGSGKGGGVFTLARFPFEKVLGVEISEKLVYIAKRNAARLKLKNISFLCEDAGKFSELDKFTHIYIFNACPIEVTKEVIVNLEASLVRKPRTLFLIIKGPDSLEKVICSRLFKRRDVFRFPYTQPFYVYVHEMADSQWADD